jgi:hypothetical protein
MPKTAKAIFWPQRTLGVNMNIREKNGASMESLIP